MKEEFLWNGRYRLRQAPSVFALSMDTMALGAFVDLRSGDRICDLGCGSGALALLLAGQEVPFTYTGVDVSPAACALTAENLTANGLHGIVVEAEIQSLPQRLPAGGMRLVLSNPPYYPPERGKAGTLARTGCDLDSLCAAAEHLLVHGGRFALIYPSEQLPNLFGTMTAHRLEPKRLQLLSHRGDKPPRLALVEGRKGGRPGLTLLPQGVLFHRDGTPTAYHRRIYHTTQ